MSGRRGYHIGCAISPGIDGRRESRQAKESRAADRLLARLAPQIDDAERDHLRDETLSVLEDPQFAAALARVFKSRYILVCEHLDEPVTRVRTLAVWMADPTGVSASMDFNG